MCEYARECERENASKFKRELCQQQASMYMYICVYIVCKGLLYSFQGKDKLLEFKIISWVALNQGKGKNVHNIAIC